MGSIIILDENTANKIAAGEVIERPASVIKELVENSIDAGATGISVEIRNGGISFIRVTDNGCGMPEDDVEIAFERHATSKIRSADDLQKITSMGFRGEALASIAAVSEVLLTTRVRDAVQGTSIEVKGGCVMDVRPAGCQAGTSVTVKNLFFNTPARYKFLKKDSTEAGYVSDVLSRIALGHPEISFRLVSNGITVLHTPGNGDLKSTIFSVYGSETAKHLLEINYQDENTSIAGYIGKAEIARSNRNHQSIFVNGRYVRNKTVTSAIDSACATFFMKNRYPFVLLNISVNPSFIDVNVHPSKMEVKFSNEHDIYRAVYYSVNNALLTRSTIRTFSGNPHDDEKYSTSVNMAYAAGKAYNGGKPYAAGTANVPMTTNSLNEKSNARPVYNQQDFELVRKELDRKRADAIAESKIIAEKAAIMDNAENYENAATKPLILGNKKIIGQAFSTYIFLEDEDEIYLVDQHAAHERIRYEELKKAFEKNERFSQMLMSVVNVELTASEYQFALSEAPFFERLGFTYEGFGSYSLLLRSVPFVEDNVDTVELFMDILDFVMNGKNGEKDVIADEALYRIACKSAVKANRKLDEIEIRALLNRLDKIENPYTCPHGRPVVLKLRRYDMEKLFKRIV